MVKVEPTTLDQVKALRVRTIAVFGALLMVLTGCRVDVRIDVTADDAGAGLIEVTVDIDSEAAANVPGLAEDLRVDDLVSSGWTIEGPTLVNSGGQRVVLRYAFESPAEGTAALRQISGVNGPLLNPELKRTVDGRTVATTLDATLQFVGGMQAFSDMELSTLLGDAPWATTAAKLGADPNQSVSLTLVAHLPGEIKKSTGTEAEGGVVWNAATDGTAQTVVIGTLDTKVDGGVWKTIATIIGYVLGIWLIVMGILMILVLLARRRKAPTNERRAPTETPTE